jgi:hypothetical protein
MMPEMDANRPAYGVYEEQQRSVPPYEPGYQVPPTNGGIDDNFIEAVSQRIAQQIARQSAGKVNSQKRSTSELPAGLRGAIAIVSVCVLIPIGIPLGLQGFAGLMALGFIGAVILLVNAIANGVFSPRD